MKKYTTLKRNFLILLILTLPASIKSQTLDFAGIYQFGSSGSDEASGTAYIYAESDSTILFYIKVDNGKLTNQRGFVYGRAVVRGGDGIFYQEFKGSDKPCKLYFEFTKKQMLIESGADQEECGMGKDVYPDATYRQLSRRNSDEFVDLNGTKRKFKELEL